MQRLTYLERVPREPGENKAPMLVLLHGRKAHAKTIFSIEGLLDARLHVCALQAPYPIEGGFEWVQNHDYSNTESQDMIAETIRMLVAERQVDPERLFLLGFSQGAAMTILMSLNGMLKVRGAVPMGGFLPKIVRSWEKFSTETKFYFAHGDNDEEVPISRSIDANQFLLDHGIQSEFHEYKGRHKMSLSSLREIDEWLKKDFES
jgi:phospholipase/carboxylesterase